MLAVSSTDGIQATRRIRYVSTRIDLELYLSAEVARLERRESEIAGLAQSAARTPPSPPRGGRASPARTFSPARRADPSEAGADADLNC